MILIENILSKKYTKNNEGMLSFITLVRSKPYRHVHVYDIGIYLLSSCQEKFKLSEHEYIRADVAHFNKLYKRRIYHIVKED